MEGSGSVQIITDPAPDSENWKQDVCAACSLVDISVFFLTVHQHGNEREKHFLTPMKVAATVGLSRRPRFYQKVPRFLRFTSVQHRNRQSGSPLSLSLCKMK
jgi:hypothetical protein